MYPAVLAICGAWAQVTTATTADVVTLADGRALLGQVASQPPRGPLVLVLRRAWVEANVPDQFPVWERQEARDRDVALGERALRLDEWERDRREAGATAGTDPILAAVEQAQQALLRPGPPARLMIVTLQAEAVRAVLRQPPGRARLLRLGWLEGIPDVEALTPDVLARILGRRAEDRADPADIQALLPPRPEPEPEWRLQRAATEVLADPFTRFVRLRLGALPEDAPYRELVLPEGRPDEIESPPVTLLDTQAALDAYRSMLEITPRDLVTERLAGVAARGGIGAVVSDVLIPADGRAAVAARVLWVRDRAGRWGPTRSRAVTLRGEDPLLPVLAGTPGRPGDPDLAVSLMTLLNVSASPVLPDQTGPQLDAAGLAQQAFRQARAELERELIPLRALDMPPP